MTSAAEIIHAVTGCPPTQAQVRRITAIATAAGIPATDPMFTILVTLEAEYAAFSSLPDRIQSAAADVERQATQLTAELVERAKATAAAAVADQVDGSAIQDRIEIFVSGLAIVGVALLLGLALVGGWYVRQTHLAVESLSQQHITEMRGAMTVAAASAIAGYAALGDQADELRSLAAALGTIIHNTPASYRGDVVQQLVATAGVVADVANRSKADPGDGTAARHLDDIMFWVRVQPDVAAFWRHEAEKPRPRR